MKEALNSLKNGLKLALGRAIIRMVDDAGDVQRVQVQRMAGETADDLEVFYQYGFTSKPKAGAEAVVASIGGNRSHGIIIAVADRQFRLKALEGGEVALYDDLGQVVHLKRDRILIESPLKVEISAPETHVVTNIATIDANETLVSGDLSVGGNVDIAGNVSVGGETALEGNATLGSDLEVAGKSTLGAGAIKAVKLSDGTDATEVFGK